VGRVGLTINCFEKHRPQGSGLKEVDLKEVDLKGPGLSRAARGRESGL
jgi:hypothetical protein